MRETLSHQIIEYLGYNVVYAACEHFLSMHVLMGVASWDFFKESGKWAWAVQVVFVLYCRAMVSGSVSPNY